MNIRLASISWLFSYPNLKVESCKVRRGVFMPQIVKGGKYVYGWSKVSNRGKIVIPNEAKEEYNLTTCNEVILMPGSKRSGGFSLTTKELLKTARLSVIIDNCLKLAEHQEPEGRAIEINGKPYCWVKLNEDGTIIVPLETLKIYGINPGDLLLSVRGSNVALGFPARGPIIDEAKKHLDINLFE
jgi:bifunctional DNA-binding transcriptional regulator/antitoxin component of YhaV-PrlF toxin-antitoxin module